MEAYFLCLLFREVVAFGHLPYMRLIVLGPSEGDYLVAFGVRQTSGTDRTVGLGLTRDDHHASAAATVLEGQSCLLS